MLGNYVPAQRMVGLSMLLSLMGKSLAFLVTTVGGRVDANEIRIMTLTI